MKTIRIKNNEYPCRVTMGAMVRFKRESGKDVQQVDTSDVEGMLLFLWCCTKSACNADGVDFALTPDTFADMIEPDDFAGFFNEVAGTEEKKTEDGPVKQ